MEETRKHMCKFCSKIFPCGRSLGGHMRSHLINVSPSDHQNTHQKLPKKKLPPLTNPHVSDSYGLRENPKKFAKRSENDTLLDQEEKKICKECGKTFQSWKALFGHMKSHSVSGKATISLEEHSRNTSSSDNQSDNEAATITLCRKKRSERTKRYTTTTTATTNSSSLTVSHFSPSDSETDQQEQAEVALSLILLSSMDKGSFGNLSQSSATGFDCLEAKKRKRLICFSGDEEIFESEVNSPKINNNRSKSDHFRSDFEEKTSKFKCVICRKGFATYQALGGHRASHKKFKGCCAPTSDQNGVEAENPNPKKHECPICFKVFGSGQALGGHKRSHLINDQTKTIDPSDRVKNIDPSDSIPEVREFIDLNLPAPVEEECDAFNAWWIDTSHKHQHEPLLGLLSS